MAGKEVFLFLSGVAKTDDGNYASLHKGDAVPDNLADGELERLRRIGAFGEPADEKPETRASDLVAADEGSLQEFVDGAKVDEVVEAAGNDPELASRLLDAERRGNDRKSAIKGLEAVIESE